MLVLGIESSCDETGLALYDSKTGLIAEALHSQILLHQQYGGVVPELASRDHVKYLIPLLEKILKEADLEKKNIDAVAYTAGPGLIGALLAGACFAKSLAYGLQIPALAIHHLEAHLLAAKLDNPKLNFPFVVLLVSGGHTQLIEASNLGVYRLLGETLDDAVGEAFDKTAKLMGIPYPGGAELAALADEFNPYIDTPLKPFPCPMTKEAGLDFSFSGLKTHALHVWNASAKDDKAQKAIAYAFQQAVLNTLTIKCKRAIQQTGVHKLVVAGGVGANKALRALLTQIMQENGGEIFFPRTVFCTDNGAMVAYAGCLYLMQGIKDKDWAIDVKARWPFCDGQSFL